MNEAEYAEYEKTVGKFFEREGINNLTSGVIECEECGHNYPDNDYAPCDCGIDYDSASESYFTWRSCDCCGRLGGDKETATGYNPTTKEIYTYEICLDCVYYAEYGQLCD